MMSRHLGTGQVLLPRSSQPKQGPGVERHECGHGWTPFRRLRAKYTRKIGVLETALPVSPASGGALPQNDFVLLVDSDGQAGTPPPTLIGRRTRLGKSHLTP